MSVRRSVLLPTVLAVVTAGALPALAVSDGNYDPSKQGCSAHADDSEHVVRLSVSKPVIEQAPEVEDGEFDREAIAIYYGLVDAPSDIDPDDPESTEEAEELSLGREPAAERRARMARHEESSGPHGRQIIPSDSHEGP